MKSSAVKVSLSITVRVSLHWLSLPGYSALNVNFSFHDGLPPSSAHATIHSVNTVLVPEPEPGASVIQTVDQTQPKKADP